MGLILGIQIITGLLLAVHYVPSADAAYESVVHIIRDVNGGWFIRSLHMNGASFFFIFLYLHIGRGIYYRAWAHNRRAWLIGSSLFILSMVIAFLGYVLPWGQIRYWAATVITRLVSAVPIVGNYILE